MVFGIFIVRNITSEIDQYGILMQLIRQIIFLPLILVLHSYFFVGISKENKNKRIQVLDPCAANVLRSYQVNSPPFLCSDTNINGFMFSVEGQEVSTGYYIIKPNTNPFLVEYDDGTFRLEISVIMKSDVSKEYLIQMEGSSKSLNNPTAGFTPALNYCASVNSDGWIFYNQFILKLEGKNANSGQYFEFSSPQANKHTFQIGQGANTWQSTLGSGLWFDNANINGGVATIKGDLQISLTPYECCKPNICVPFVVNKTKTIKTGN